MHFYLRLADVKDDAKLKGMVLFDKLSLGQGQQEYHLVYGEVYEDYTYEVEKYIRAISKKVPTARICFDSYVDEGTGESDVYCKMENDPEVYHCSTLWFSKAHYSIGEDGWCERVKRQAAEDMEDY